MKHPYDLGSHHRPITTDSAEAKQAKLMRTRLNLAKARADVPVVASCACRMQHPCCED